MQNLNKDLKEKKFKHIYLLYGEEDYLISMYKKRLINAMSDPDDSMNYNYFEGKDTSVGQLIDLAETMPFFAPRRLIVVENSLFFKNSQDKLADYLKSFPETTTFLFVEREVDKRGRMFKAVTADGYAAEMKVQDTGMLQSWILGRLKNEGYRITNGAMNLLLLYTGADMNLIENELEKLISYCVEKKEIHAGDVETISSRRVEDHIFDMIEAVATQRQARALQLYYDLLALKVAPAKILILMNRQFNYMYQVKALQEKGYDRNSIAEKTNLKPFIAGKYLTQSQHFTLKRLRRLIERGCGIEESIKTGRIQDKLAVELMLINFSSQKR